MTDALALAPKQYLKHEDFQPCVTIKESRPPIEDHEIIGITC